MNSTETKFLEIIERVEKEEGIQIKEVYKEALCKSMAKGLNNLIIDILKDIKEEKIV